MEGATYFDVRKLIVWQRAHELTLLTYKLTESFPKSEVFGLSSQMRRAAVSIGSNITEGKARGTKKEYKRFLFIAKGSNEELRYQLLVSKDLGYIDSESFIRADSKSIEITKMLNSLIGKLSN